MYCFPPYLFSYGKQHSESGMFYFTTNRLGFSPEFLGRVKLVTSVASLLGVGLYIGFFEKCPFPKDISGDYYYWYSSRDDSSFAGHWMKCQLGISDEWFAIGDSLRIELTLLMLSSGINFRILPVSIRICLRVFPPMSGNVFMC